MSREQALQRFDPRLAAAVGAMQEEASIGELMAEGGSPPHLLRLASSQPSSEVIQTD